jgi:alkylhydroperoxidase/carboxymuconolactone decarboxylase family protein YurZ
MENNKLVSNAFQVFLKEAGNIATPWMEAVKKIESSGYLDHKTAELAYISVLSVLQLDSGLPFHVKSAREKGATREEIIGAVLVGLPAAGIKVTQSLPIALDAYDNF